MDNRTLFHPSLSARFFALIAALFVLALPGLAQAQGDTRNFVRLLGTCDSKGACAREQQLALHNENGALEISIYEDGWWSAQWELIIDQNRNDGVKLAQIRNRWTGALIGAAYDLAKPKDQRWSLVLVKPGDMMRSLKEQMTDRGVASWVSVDAPMEDFPDSFVWHLVPSKDGTTAIINASVMGLRENAPVEHGTALLAPRVKVGELSALVVGTALLNADGSLAKDAPGWTIQPTGEFLLVEGTEKVRIVNNGGPATLNIETGSPAAGPVQPGWLSAQWVAKNVAGGDSRGRIFQNVWTGKYLGVVNGGLAMVDADPVGMASGRLDSISYSWQVEGRSTKEGTTLFSMRNMKSGQYLTLPEGASLGLGAAASYQWSLADIEAPVVAAAPEPERMVRLRWMKNEAVHIENGPPTVGGIQPGWWSAQWVAQEMSGQKGQRLIAFRNRWKGGFLMIRNGQVISDQPDNNRPINEPTDAEEIWVVEGIQSDSVTLRHGRTGQYLAKGAEGALIPLPTPSTKQDGWSIEDAQ